MVRRGALGQGVPALSLPGLPGGGRSGGRRGRCPGGSPPAVAAAVPGVPAHPAPGAPRAQCRRPGASASVLQSSDSR